MFEGDFSVTCANNFALVNGGTSGPVKCSQRRSKEHHPRKPKFFIFSLAENVASLCLQESPTSGIIHIRNHPVSPPTSQPASHPDSNHPILAFVFLVKTRIKLRSWEEIIFWELRIYWILFKRNNWSKVVKNCLQFSKIVYTFQKLSKIVKDGLDGFLVKFFWGWKKINWVKIFGSKNFLWFNFMGGVK